MKRQIPGLYLNESSSESKLEGLFLVRVDRARYRWHPQRPFVEFQFSVRAQPARVRVAPDEYLRCPNCGSTDLKKVSLAYQEGLFYTAARTRLRAVAVGGCGPDLVIGKATTRGFHQSVLSKQ